MTHQVNIVELQTKLDAYKAMRDMRLEEDRKDKAMKEKEQAIQYELITFLMDNPELNGIMGTTHKALLKDNTIPIVEDYAEFRAYVIENEAWIWLL